MHFKKLEKLSRTLINSLVFDIEKEDEYKYIDFVNDLVHDLSETAIILEEDSILSTINKKIIELSPDFEISIVVSHYNLKPHTDDVSNKEFPLSIIIPLNIENYAEVYFLYTNRKYKLENGVPFLFNSNINHGLSCKSKMIQDNPDPIIYWIVIDKIVSMKRLKGIR